MSKVSIMVLRPRLFYPFLALALATVTSAASAPHPAPRAATHTFTFGGPDNSQFLLDGQPFQIRAGELDPARIPPAYWRQRMRMAKAMGLNTLSSYVFWNRHEEPEGHFDFSTGDRDIGRFLQIAREEGLWVILRPGPYVCGEWEFGGQPWWLLKAPDIRLRSLDPRYTMPAARYIHEAAKMVRPNLVQNGGPVVLVQLENEYGSYPRRDLAFVEWLRDRWVAEGVPGLFSIADSPSPGYLKDTALPGVATGLDSGVNEENWQTAAAENPGVPVFTAEIYPGWLCHWGEEGWKPKDISRFVKFYMENKKSFSLYMFHGGTNFGLTTGSNDIPPFKPDLTSYDYGAPLDEQGRPTPAYHALRAQIASYLPGEKLPEIPPVIPMMTIPEIALARQSNLWEQLPEPIAADAPACFEVLGQNQGLMLYRTRLPAHSPGGHLELTVHDYAVVAVDGKKIGVIDRREGPQGVDLPPTGDQPATLDILVEAMAHANFQIQMETDRKGLIGPVKLAGIALTHWQIFPFPLRDAWAAAITKTAPTGAPAGGIFQGTFTLDQVADTYIDLRGYQKGYVWVNGHNLGRYWSIGPQFALYCPAPWLKQGKNTIVVLDVLATEPAPVRGVTSPR
jgi:beta-galactosidase